MIDELGDRMKKLEGSLTNWQFTGQAPVIARLDGRAFSAFTSGLRKPYDANFNILMAEVTKALVKETNAIIGYTQSDEISLLFFPKHDKEELYFGGKVYKMISQMASFCTATFNKLIPQYLPKEWHNKVATFDCRVFEVPTLIEGINCLIWRQKDAVRNAVTRMASMFYSHKILQGKSTREKFDMITIHGADKTFNDEHFRRGIFIKRVNTLTKFSTEELSKLPEKHEARTNPDFAIIRKQIIEQKELPLLEHIKNPIEFLLLDAVPELK